MRELKFRAYSKIQKRMFPVYGLGQDWVTEDTIDGVDPGVNCFDGYDFLNDITIMQFTGIKDKNGEEIYDGDIIGYWNIVDGKRKQSKQQVFWNEFTASFHVDHSFEQDKSISEELWKAINDFQYEVIGNIHEP